MTKADVALRNLTVDLGYLSTPHSSAEPLPPHLERVVSDYATNLPKTNPFMAAVLSVKLPAQLRTVDLGQSAIHDAVRKDAVRMLQVLHTELGGTHELEHKIDALKYAGSDTLIADTQATVAGLQRNVIDSAHKAFSAMHEASKGGLWSRTESTEQDLSRKFAQGEAALAKSIALFDSGHVQEALTVYAQTLKQNRDAIDTFSSATDTDFYLKFGTGIGVLIGAGFAAAYTGGGALYAMTGSATVTEATGIGAYTASLLVGGTAFTATEKFLTHKIFDVPYFTSNDRLENALEFTQNSLKMAALMGFMNGYIKVVELPVYKGVGETVINFNANLANEFVGLTAFTAITEGPSTALDADAIPQGLAQLLGLKFGNIALLKTGQVTFKKSADFINGLRNLMPEPATGYPMLMMMPADLSADRMAEGGISVFGKAKNFFGSLYFGKGEMPWPKKIPLGFIGLANTFASFIAANAVRCGIESSSGFLHEMAPRVFGAVEKAGVFWDPSKWDTTLFRNAVGYIALLGFSLFIPRVANSSSKLKTYPNNAPIPLVSKAGYYTWEVINRGLLGAVRLAGDRNPTEIGWIRPIKHYLQSDPIQHGLATFLKAPTFEKPIRVVSAFPDKFMRLMGEVLPNTGGRFAGFGIDIIVNSGISFMNAKIINEHAEFWPSISAGIVVTALMAFANTRITQHQGFDPSQVLTQRTVLGVGKGAVYGGICSTTGVVPSYLNVIIQGGYGLFSMWYAEKVAALNPPIGNVTSARASATTSAKLMEATRELSSAQLSGISPTIVVIDSGLGGMVTVARLNEQLQNGPFPNARVVYYNALPAWGRGFNTLPEATSAAVLDRALQLVTEKYSPTVIIMPDHTLSTRIYPHTSYAQTSPVPVVTAVPPTVDLMVAGLKKYPNAKVVIMGSISTVQSGRYQSLLTTRHIPSSRVLTETCPALGIAIEQEPNHAPIISQLIDQHVASIVRQLGDVTTPVLITLANTQLSFVRAEIEASLAKHGLRNARVIDPTENLTRGLFDGMASANSSPQVNNVVVSQVDLKAMPTGTILPQIEQKSSPAGQALRSFTLEDPGFHWPTEGKDKSN